MHHQVFEVPPWSCPRASGLYRRTFCFCSGKGRVANHRRHRSACPIRTGKSLSLRKLHSSFQSRPRHRCLVTASIPPSGSFRRLARPATGTRCRVHCRFPQHYHHVFHFRISTTSTKHLTPTASYSPPSAAPLAQAPTPRPQSNSSTPSAPAHPRNPPEPPTPQSAA